MSNKFVSFLKKVGEDFVKGLNAILPWASTAGEVAVADFAPALGPLFNQTVSAVVTAEQAAVAAGQQKTGPSKLSAVVQLMGPLIKQGLSDAGKPADDAAVQTYINSVVQVLNAAPAPTSAPPPPSTS
jgi:hypothetical protein